VRSTAKVDLVSRGHAAARPFCCSVSWSRVGDRRWCLRPRDYMVIGVRLLVPGTLRLLIDGEPSIGAPGPDLPMFGLVMLVAVGVLLDDLAVHHRKARRPERGRAGRAQNMRTVRGVTYELRLNGRSKTQGWVLTALCDR
jgi:hypothetical protein